MRVLHAAHMRLPAVGVIRQMEDEQAAAEKLGLPWAARLFVPTGNFSKLCASAELNAEDRLAFKSAYYTWLMDESVKYDVILLRYSTSDPFQWRFLNKSKIPVLLVHHTLEVPEMLGGSGLLVKIKAYAEQLLGPMSIRKASGIVAVTQEIAAYESRRSGRSISPVLIYPNGIRYENDIKYIDRRDNSIPELLFVASNFFPWHGLDVLMKAVSRSSSHFSIHLVGILTEEQKFHAASDNRYVIHGRLKPMEIATLSERCWVGLSSFALHRKKMRESCSLKVREYLRAGLPVYSGEKDVFGESMRFYRFDECTMENILAFAYEMRSATKEEVSLMAQPYIDKQILLKRLYEQLFIEFAHK